MLKTPEQVIEKLNKFYEEIVSNLILLGLEPGEKVDYFKLVQKYGEINV